MNYDKVPNVTVAKWSDESEDSEPEWEGRARAEEMYVDHNDTFLIVRIEVYDQGLFDITIPINRSDDWRAFVKSLLDTL